MLSSSPDLFTWHNFPAFFKRVRSDQLTDLHFCDTLYSCHATPTICHGSSAGSFHAEKWRLFPREYKVNSRRVHVGMSSCRERFFSKSVYRQKSLYRPARFSLTIILCPDLPKTLLDQESAGSLPRKAATTEWPSTRNQFYINQDQNDIKTRCFMKKNTLNGMRVLYCKVSVEQFESFRFVNSLV